MNSQQRAFHEFAEFAAKLKGDEKSEAQLFLIQLLDAFGHDGKSLPEGSTFEYRVRFPGDRTKYADFVWPKRVLIEMKSRGEKLSKHYQQTFDYWLNLTPHRPPYVVLCNFDEFWIYDFNTQLQEPMDRLTVKDLVDRHDALKFLFPIYRPSSPPIFGNNWVEVTREAANNVALAFNEMVFRGEPRDRARRFILQCVVSMFSEDIGLLPENLFTELLNECRRSDDIGATSYDLLGQLFRQMNDPNPARGGRFAGVDYFNGGLFSKVDPIELTPGELGLLFEASKEKWQYVQPVIFGTLFEGSLDKEQRHALGAHFTYEADIQKIVRPTIVRPWEERIAAAKNVAELLELLRQLRAFRVLDPACGSGNFLFVAYRALHDLEQRLLLRLFEQDKRQFAKVGLASGISPKQFFGLDVNENAVETAKVTLMLARRIAHREADKFWEEHSDMIPGDVREQALRMEKDLPLDNLDKNIRAADALFTPWPEVDAIIGNPPFLGSRYLAQEHGYDYARKIYAAFPEVPQMADFCVHWFRKAHNNLKQGCRAGLIGRNSIRHNESREASLDFIVNNGGTIIEAVSSQVWPGEAVVHVSMVNWIKGKAEGRKRIFTQLGDAKNSDWKSEEVGFIPASLSAKTDVGQAKDLLANQEPKRCFQGQNPVNEGFFLEPQEALQLLKEDESYREVLFPYMIGDDLVGEGKPTRWIIDFAQREMTEAMRYAKPFELVKKAVMPAVLAKAEAEKKATGKEKTRWTRMANRWWQFRDYQPGLMNLIATLPRYVACSRTTRRPIFEFVSSQIHPDTKLAVLAFADDYSFGIIQSGIHWEWVLGRCSTWKRDFNYTGNTVFDTFAWPQSPTLKQIHAVVIAARELRHLRREIMVANGWSLRELYKTLETPGANRLRTAHETLDAAVRAAYGMKANDDILAFLLKLNLELAGKEAKAQAITPPGLPAWVKNPDEFVTVDCVSAEQPKSGEASAQESEAAAAAFYNIMGKEEGPEYRVK